jgi:hypothetical protein
MNKDNLLKLKSVKVLFTLTSAFAPIVVPHKEVAGKCDRNHVDDKQVSFKIHRLHLGMR